MAKRVADVVVETLQAAGVKRCWGVPGDTLNFVTDAIRSAWLFTESDHYRLMLRQLTACADFMGKVVTDGLFDEGRQHAGLARTLARRALSKRHPKDRSPEEYRKGSP
jgi:hypothetical protein